MLNSVSFCHYSKLFNPCFIEEDSFLGRRLFVRPGWEHRNESLDQKKTSRLENEENGI